MDYPNVKDHPVLSLALEILALYPSHPPLRCQVHAPLERGSHSHLTARLEPTPEDCENSIPGTARDTEQASQPSQGYGRQGRDSPVGIFSC